MSSSKRRKVGGTPPLPQSPASSAVSAIAARRQLAATSLPTASVDNEQSAASNSFAALAHLGQHNDNADTTLRGIQGTETSKPEQERPRKSSRRDDAAGKTVRREAATRAAQYCSFAPSNHNHAVRPSGVVELRLEQSERLMILGSFGIKVLTGEVTVYGASLRPDDALEIVHAPQCHALPVLRTAERTKIQLHPVPNSFNLRKLGRLSPLFNRLWNEAPEQTEPSHQRSRQTFQILWKPEDAPSGSIIQELVSPPEWNKKLASLSTLHMKSTPLRILVCGPKSAGKSTFSKLLLNRLLSKRREGPKKGASDIQGVATLDLDPGQPEYSPPGFLSLVQSVAPNTSASFAHPAFRDGNATRVLRSHAIASVTPASDPDLYRQCAEELFRHYCETLPNAALIVNAPGWILGTGLELLVQLIADIKPTHVIYMSEDGPAESVDVLRGAAKESFSTLPSQQSDFTTRTAAHFRAMQAMSYFHFNDAPGGADWEARPLTDVVPWAVRFTEPNQGFLGFVSYDYQAPPELLESTVNGMLVAVVEIDTSEALHAIAGATVTADVISRTTDGIPFITNHNGAYVDPRSSQSIGLALIRGIDKTTHSLHLVTPISQERIKESRSKGKDLVLLYGKFDQPHWAYTEGLYARSRRGQESTASKALEIVDGDTSEDDSDDTAPEMQRFQGARGAVPWVETLRGNERRPVGSRVWRVRRDLGKSSGGG